MDITGSQVAPTPAEFTPANLGSYAISHMTDKALKTGESQGINEGDQEGYVFLSWVSLQAQVTSMEAAEDGSSIWGSATYVGDQDKVSGS